MKTRNIFGTEYPIIKELGDGWDLIAHPNGPAIANDEWLSTIEIHLEDCCPSHIKQRAQEAWREFSWPLLKDRFFPTNP